MQKLCVILLYLCLAPPDGYIPAPSLQPIAIVGVIGDLSDYLVESQSAEAGGGLWQRWDRGWSPSQALIPSLDVRTT